MERSGATTVKEMRAKRDVHGLVKTLTQEGDRKEGA
jgi:hypothetical protein